VPILSKRCLIPSTGYFEFHHAGKDVIPYYIFLRNEAVFSLGAIFDVWHNPATNETVQSFAVLTTPANTLCSEIHNGGKNPYRMPLIIHRENEEQWLDNSLKANDINRLIKPFESDLMDAYAITRDFVKRNPKDSTIIEPAA
jgi:putative SOS response-associated peptidase YedK